MDPTFRLTTDTLSVTLTDPATAQDFNLAKTTVASAAPRVISPLPAARESVIAE